MAGINGIQQVSLALAKLLADRMERRDVVFTFGLPKPDEPAPRLNLFLYDVRESPHVRNEPVQLGLELGYLITAYGGGADVDLDAQEVLADAMRVLHDDPILVGSEPLRITPRALNIDEMTKLWIAFREDYRCSAAYQVSVLRIAPAKPA